MSTEDIDDLDRELKRLERDRRIEEIRQLKASGRRSWITPTALAALLPLLAGFGVWSIGEIKQFNEGYAALAERDRLRADKEALQRQKDSLNVEVTTLLNLKGHYAEQAKDLQARFVTRQQELDRIYLRARFASDEASYAVEHLTSMAHDLDRATLDRLRAEVRRSPGPSADALLRLIDGYRMALDIIPISRETLAVLRETLKLIPASDWTGELKSMPTGAVAAGRKIMVQQVRRGGQSFERHYDVDEGRFLADDEVTKR